MRIIFSTFLVNELAEAPPVTKRDVREMQGLYVWHTPLWTAEELEPRGVGFADFYRGGTKVRYNPDAEPDHDGYEDEDTNSRVRVEGQLLFVYLWDRTITPAPPPAPEPSPVQPTEQFEVSPSWEPSRIPEDSLRSEGRRARREREWRHQIQLTASIRWHRKNRRTWATAN